MTSNNFSHRLDLAAFAEIFGTTADAMPAACRDLISTGDFRYRVLDGAERDSVILQVLKRVDQRGVQVAGRHQIERWEKGWGENLTEFLESRGDVGKLVPKYIRPGLPLRLHQNFVLAADPWMELTWYVVLRRWLAETYFREVPAVFEFGCGSGYNVAALAELFPEKRIFGLDWAQASVDIVENLRGTAFPNVTGKRFDFFNPDRDLDVPAGSAFLTVGALEQTGTEWGEFLRFTLEKKPAICVHLEPVIELYDSENLVDYTAIRCLQERKFFSGYIDALRALEAEGKVEVIKVKRSYFGSLMLESYAQIVWRPL